MHYGQTLTMTCTPALTWPPVLVLDEIDRCAGPETWPQPAQKCLAPTSDADVNKEADRPGTPDITQILPSTGRRVETLGPLVSLIVPQSHPEIPSTGPLSRHLRPLVSLIVPSGLSETLVP